MDDFQQNKQGCRLLLWKISEALHKESRRLLLEFNHERSSNESKSLRSHAQDLSSTVFSIYALIKSKEVFWEEPANRSVQKFYDRLIKDFNTLSRLADNLDMAAKKSRKLEAKEKRFFIKSRISYAHRICKKLAKELASTRIRARNLCRQMKTSRMKTRPIPNRPNIFVSSSKEALPVARAIKSELDSEAMVVIWNQGHFPLGETTIESLERAVKEFHFAIVVLQPDDKTIVRKKTKKTARDNVIFEFGLFVGGWGRKRAFVVHPSDAEIWLPSNLNGVVTAAYKSEETNIAAAVGSACDKIRQAISKARKEK